VGRLAGGLRPPGALRSCSDDEPWKVAADALGNVENNQYRMDDPGDRRLGLLIVSVTVESLIKPMNRRMKGTEPFWKEGDGGPVAGESGVRDRRRSGGALLVFAAAAPTGRWNRSPSPWICTNKNGIAPGVLVHPFRPADPVW
jgi:hypothetical protein